MKLILSISFILVLSGCIGAGKISDIDVSKKGHFPTLTGIDLLGEDRIVPDDLSGDYRLITIGFKREHQEDINTWITVSDDLFSERPDVRFYELPIIYEINGMYRTWINNGMRSGIPDPVARERTITIYTDRPKFLDQMKMAEDKIYTLLLDKKGKILWRETGIATPEKQRALERAVPVVSQ